MNMKYFAMVAVILLVGCDTPPPSAATSEGAEPLQGVQIPYDDTPGLVKTEMRNAADGLGGIGYYQDGKKSGSWVEYDQNNMIKSVTTYVNGKREGITLEFNNNQIVRQYLSHNDRRHGEYVEYNGVRIREVRHYEAGKMEGVTRIYYDNGTLMEESHYANGLRDGVSKWFDQAGNLSIQYEYNKGELIKK